MAKIRNKVQLEIAMTKRLMGVKGGIAGGMKEIRDQAHADLIELTSGTPQGVKARRKWLRQMGHPFGRGSQAETSTPSSGKRRAKGRAKSLPIGVQSGKLRSAAFATVNKNLVGKSSTRITMGFNKKAGKSIMVVLPMGTPRMVSRGMMLPGGKGEVGKRMKVYRRAFYNRYISKAWKAP